MRKVIQSFSAIKELKNAFRLYIIVIFPKKPIIVELSLSVKDENFSLHFKNGGHFIVFFIATPYLVAYRWICLLIIITNLRIGV